MLSDVYSQSSPRHPTAVSKSPDAPVAFLACYLHPTSLITLLKYFCFIVTDSVFLLNTLSYAFRQCTVNHLQSIISQTPCSCIQISRHPSSIPSMLHTVHPTSLIQPLRYSDSQNYCNVLVLLSLCEIAHDWIRSMLSNNKIDFTPSSQLQKEPYIT